MRFVRTIGILGGMGPFAGTALVDRVLRTAARDHGARGNDEFPRVVFLSVPVPSLVSDRADEGVALAMVDAALATLERAGADVMALACVTMHGYRDRLAAGAGMEWVSLVDLAVEEVVARRMRRPLLLTSSTTAERRILAEPLVARGVEPIVLPPEEQAAVDGAVHALVAGADPVAVGGVLAAAERSAVERGADGVVLGCTELTVYAPLARIPVVDPVEAAAAALCRAAARVAG